MWPETRQLLQYSGAGVRVGDSDLIAALSVSIVHLGSSPPSHLPRPLSQVQTEILSLTQTNWPETRSVSANDMFVQWKVKKKRKHDNDKYRLPWNTILCKVNLCKFQVCNHRGSILTSAWPTLVGHFYFLFLILFQGELPIFSGLQFVII